MLFRIIWTHAHVSNEITQLTEQSHNPNLWKTPQGTQILKDLQKLKNTYNMYEMICKSYQDLPRIDYPF